MKLIRRVSEVGGLTLISRILGFTRDILMARFLGAGMASDAFFIAFKLPNFFRRLFAEGAFSAGFIPVFSKLLGKSITAESEAKAKAFAANVLAWFLPILAIFLILMEVAMVPVMLGLSGGFEGNTVKFNLLVELGWYTFPYLSLISLVALYGGMLNAYGRFAAAAFVPVLLNIFMISALILAPDNDITAARYLAIAVSLSGGAQFLWLYIAARRAGIRLKLPKPHISDDFKKFIKMVGPAAIGAGITQINLLIDTILAARFLPEGSVSWLFFADRLNQLPIGIIGVAVGTVLLPTISRSLADNDHTSAINQQNLAFQFSMLITLPAAVAFVSIAEPLITTLFERGNFDAVATKASSAALVAYACGLPAYIIGKILIPGYFARGNTKTPVKIAAIALLVNTSLNIAFIGPFGHVGLAAATAIAAWVNILLLYLGLRRDNNFYFEKTSLINSAKYMAFAILMGVGLYYLSGVFNVYFEEGEITRTFALITLILFGVVFYFAGLLLTRTVTVGDMRKLLSKER
ncbi:murein biosynthesis integral membrane protein MurJ [Kordiimonas sp. SCSIO 12610]|uniref:murein biosynthesis integral membrane protein MurJ n=1 Tax=Kordiimonas sp. SCSIO 12610 TaxID=2829597 RepID=UPI0021091782|nr:murein biosynthesis integral membrane protein MurJ [Kordiimonas sp. SCSIO 12610]UTW55519.1 murein biosynthesis integral membrane protein MurJ [Kordiimonas sp. SCSIO 12610]